MQQNNHYQRPYLHRLLQWCCLLSLGISVMAHAQNTSLPGGASSLKETHGDWIVNCVNPPADTKRPKQCVVTQEQVDQRTKQRLVAIEINSTKNTQSRTPATLILPFGLAINHGLIFQIDDGASSSPEPFLTCIPNGCLVPLQFDDKTLATLRKASSLKLKVVAVENNKELTIPVSLKGFNEAFERAMTLGK